MYVCMSVYMYVCLYVCIYVCMYVYFNARHSHKSLTIMYTTTTTTAEQLIAAVDPVEVSRLDELFERSKLNGVKDVSIMSAEQVREVEPNCKVSYG